MTDRKEKAVGILYQATSPPAFDGAVKPLKPGGYSDSGADIAFALHSTGVPVATPVENPNPEQNMDWVFPDDHSGIERAMQLGAEVLWANTVLFADHPLAGLGSSIRIVGQHPEKVECFDDKWFTHNLLKRSGLPVASGCLIRQEVRPDSLCPEELTPQFFLEQELSFPVVLKPVRGRGSQGVMRIPAIEGLLQAVDALLNATYSDANGVHSLYGSSLILEEYLPGDEITVTVMPPGNYEIDGQSRVFPEYWSLPPVARFHHQNGIAPYSGSVAVIRNSAVLTEAEVSTPGIESVTKACNRAAQLVGASAPIRIDCRQNKQGVFCLFDVNMKPNMTGVGRPGREDQDSLTAMAARAIGWSFPELVRNILHQAWSTSKS